MVELNVTGLDEKNPVRYNKDMSGTTDFPYAKTLSGALQPKTSDKNLLQQQIAYAAIAILGLLY